MNIEQYLEIISECGLNKLVDEFRDRGDQMNPERLKLISTILEICENVESDSRYYDRIKKFPNYAKAVDQI